MTYVLALLATLLAWGGTTRRGENGAGADGGVTIPVGPVEADRSAIPLPPVTRARGEHPPLVVIDPGHGGRDPGATSPFGVVEKDVTLALARRMRDELASSGRVRVALTRD